MMKQKLQEIREEAVKQIQNSDALDKLNDVRVAFLGKKGKLTAVLKGMKDVAAEERPMVGQMVNEKGFWRRRSRGWRRKPGKNS